jgi:hypothetical protein
MTRRIDSLSTTISAIRWQVSRGCAGAADGVAEEAGAGDDGGDAAEEDRFARRWQAVLAGEFLVVLEAVRLSVIQAEQTEDQKHHADQKGY